MPTGPFRDRVQKRKEAIMMSDYEMLVIVLMFLTIVVALLKK